MSTDLNQTIAALARTSIYSTEVLTRIAEEYPDADFLRFVTWIWGSGVRLAVWQLAELFYAHPGGIRESAVQDHTDGSRDGQAQANG